MGLADLVFSDLCIDETIENSWYKVAPDSLGAQPLPADCITEADAVLASLQEHHRQVGKPNFRFVWQGNPLRAQRMQLPDRAVFICRRFQDLKGGLVDLGMPRPVAAELLSSKLRDGLVVILGKAGAGKTTAAGTLITERLTTLGGICWTTENPIELSLAGRHGQGVCYQTEAESDAGMASQIAAMYRATPNMIFVGEARDSHTVHEALIAALSGHLVILTLHAGDIITGISRLAGFHGGDNALRVLSDALRILVHLELHNHDSIPVSSRALLHNTGRPTGTPPRVLAVEPLLVNADSIQAIIRDGSFHLLRSEIERQRRGFMAQGGR